MALSIGRLAFEHHRIALGIAETEPRISWRFNGTVSNWKQSGYEIEIARNDDAPKSFQVDSSESVYVPWPDEPLGEAEGAEVRVRASGSGSDTPWSDWVHVETGLTETWADVNPITTLCKQQTDEAKRPIYFHKDFDVPANLKSARLYITALGIYEAEINGKRVGDHVLAPGWQSYHHRHIYDTYDVTDMLVAGEKSVLGAVVGEGWYAGRLGWVDGGHRNIYGDTLGLLSILVMTTEDNIAIKIPTDPSWKSLTSGAVTSGEIYHGEHFDDRIAAKMEGWTTIDFNGTSGWSGTRSLEQPQGRLSSPDQPPMRIVEEVKPVRFFKSPSGEQLVDFGQNLVGWLRVTVKGPSGHNIRLLHAEVLDNGELARRPLRKADQEEQIWLSGREITYEPKFTFHGFRYAQIDNWPADYPLDADHVTAMVVHTDMERTGWFECSNELLNQFHSNVRWSMRGNFLSIPTDCPQRDERAGWTGDAHMFGPTSNYLYDTAGFWRGWHRDVWSEMSSSAGGMVPFSFTPTFPTDFLAHTPTAIWGDVVVGSPWNLYQAFGDLAVVREQLPQAQGWIDQGIPRNAEGLWSRRTFQFGDWLDPQTPAENPTASMTNSHLVADAYLVHMTGHLADMLEALGESQAAEYYAQYAQLKAHFQDAWMDEGRLANTSQTAYALSLAFDLFPNEDDLNTGSQVMQELIASNDYLVGTGFAGTALLGRALNKANATEEFYKMLLQQESPGWMYQVVMGATTNWERWNGILPDGSLNTDGMLSFNHYAFGSVAEWIHQTIGGIDIAEPGYKKVLVAPIPGGDITEAKATFLSPYGQVSTNWHVDKDGFHLELEVPANSEAVVILPGSKETTTVGSGLHTFTDSEFQMPSK